MAIQSISIEQFIDLSKEHLVFDVRSPSEYQHAHIPNALSLPLFNDEERKAIGTAYKQQSREVAIKIGLDAFGPKMKTMLNKAEKALQQKNSKTVLVHCWRGGMRSAAVAWLLDLYGFKVYKLEGGYKSFRNWVLAQFEKPYQIYVLSGRTGSGKTEILKKLAQLGQSIIDLEGLAGHKGSAFGGIGLPPQPSNEYFENKLALKLKEIVQKENNVPIWVESESSRIGSANINHTFFNQMKAAECVRIKVPLEGRLDKIAKEYGKCNKEDLVAATQRIQKRLGGLETKNTVDYLNQNEIKKAFKILLVYYDKAYEKSTLFQSPFVEIDLPDANAKRNANLIWEKVKNRYSIKNYEL